MNLMGLVGAVDQLCDYYNHFMKTHYKDNEHVMNAEKGKAIHTLEGLIEYQIVAIFQKASEWDIKNCAMKVASEYVR